MRHVILTIWALVLVGCVTQSSEQSLRNKIVGAYELKHPGNLFKHVYLEDGSMEIFVNGQKQNADGRWAIKKGEVVVTTGDFRKNNSTLIFRMEPNGDLRTVAREENGIREEAPKEHQSRWEKTKTGPVVTKTVKAADMTKITVGMTIQEVSTVKGQPVKSMDASAVNGSAYMFYFDGANKFTDIGPNHYFIRFTNGKVQSFGRVGEVEDEALEMVYRKKLSPEEVIRKAAKKPTGELTKADYEKVTHLTFEGQKLGEVPKGLEKLTQLWNLSLTQNRLTDVKGLENLTQLKTLRLTQNQLTDVKGLENLTQLEELGLGYNQLTDLKGLEKLPQLTKLVLSENPALTKAQIAQLQKALPKCDIFHTATK